MNFKRIFSGLSLFLFSLSVLADFQLVKDGAPAAGILLPAKATVSAQLGAYELQHHIRLMTGAELPIATGTVDFHLPGTIRIGGENQGLTGEQNKIIFRGNTLLLTGNDSPIFHKVIYSKAGTFPGLRECKGTLFAVYDFLNLYCDVHFYWMDESGTTYPRCRDLAVKTRNREFTPPMDAFRDIHIDDLNISKFKVSPRDYVLWKLRWRQSSLFGQTNHNQYSIYFAHWDKARTPALGKAFKYKSHDMFAQGYTGKNASVDPILRENYPFDIDLPPQLCYSNPKTIKYYANEALIYYRGGNVPGGWYNRNGKHSSDKTLIPRFEGKPFFYPFEGCDTDGYCLCPGCRRKFANDTQDDISHSKFTFISDIAREIAKTNPEVGISTLAYIRSYGYPKGVDLPLNISVQICPTIYAWWHPVLREKQLSAYKEWIRKEAKRRPLTLWTYIFSTYWDARFHYAKYKPFPGLYPWKTAEMFKMFARDGIRGWFTEVEMQYNHLEALIAARICYDPNLNTDQFIDDYFRNYYGKAGKIMKEFYREIENTYWDARNYPAEWSRNTKVVLAPRGTKHPYWGTGLHSPDVNWKLGTDERMKKLDGLIEQAGKLVATPEEKIRLNRIIDGIWTDALAGKKEYARFQQLKKIPPKRLMIRRIPDAGADFKKVDWSKGSLAGSWKNIYGKDIGSRCQVTAVADSQYLYLRAEDPVHTQTTAKFWMEDFEFFFAGGRAYPVYQLAVVPNGNSKQYKYNFINDAKTQSDYDFKCKKANYRQEDSWRVELAIPLNRLPVTDGQLILNFTRCTPQGNAIWTPIFTNAFLDGLDSFGTATFMPCKSSAGNWKIWGRSWRIDDPAAQDGKAVAQLVNSGWNLRYEISRNLPPGNYQVTCRIRSDVSQAIQGRVGIGFFDPKTSRTSKLKFIQLTDVAGPQYKSIKLEKCQLKPGDHFYISGLKQKLPDRKIYVDYLEFNPCD